MLIHADNFNYFGTADKTLLEDGIYTFDNSSLGCVTDPDGISIPKVLKLSNGSGSGGGALRYPLPAGATATVGVAMRIWMSSLPGTSSQRVYPIKLSDVSNSGICYLKILTNGSLAILDKNAAQLVATLIPVFTAGGWFHIEAKFTQGGAGLSSCEVRVEGVPVIGGTSSIAATGLSFGNNNNPAQVNIAVLSDGAGFGQNLYVKDYVIWDNTGSENNDFLSTVLVYDLTTLTDISMPWGSTGPDGFSVLDNNPPSDAAYISAPYPAMPAAAKFSLSNLPADVTSVKGIITRVRAAKSDGGDAMMQVSVNSNGSLANGTDRPITISQSWWSDVCELDPDTGSLWTPGSVDDISIEINRTL